MHDGQMFNKSFGEFASLMTSTEPEHSGKVYYIDEYVFAATDPALIAKDWVKPSFLTTILKSKSIAISIWAKDFERRPKYNGSTEKYICVLSGIE